MTELVRERSRRRALPAQPKLTYCNLFFAFLSASFLGAVTETVFMLLVWGELQNRSGVLWGTFSLVWGLGAVLFSVALRPAARRSGWWVFLGGALLGSSFEFLCSWMQEVCFGMRFWDYSHLPLNIDGRIDPLFAVFWGIAAVVWMELLWPALGRGLEKVAPRALRVSALILTVFMVCNIAVSAAALGRMHARRQGMPPSNRVEAFLDRTYPDERLQTYYPSMRYLND